MFSKFHHHRQRNRLVILKLKILIQLLQLLQELDHLNYFHCHLLLLPHRHHPLLQVVQLHHRHYLVLLFRCQK